jgi:hypothetical protein
MLIGFSIKKTIRILHGIIITWFYIFSSRTT